MTKDEFDDREDLYEHLLKEVAALCECGSSAVRRRDGGVRLCNDCTGDDLCLVETMAQLLVN